MNNFFGYEDLETDTRPEGRTYQYKDKKFHSVTTILDKTKPKDQAEKLEKWRKSVGEDVAEQIRSNAADIGNDVHEALEYWLIGKDYTGLLTDSVRTGIFNNISGMVSANLNSWFAVEQAVFHPELKYAGRIDLLGVWDGVPSVIDFKTKTKVPDIRYIKNYGVQLSAYLTACNYHQELLGREWKFKRLVILAATPTATVEPVVIDVESIDYKSYYNQFIYRLELFHKLRSKV